MLLRDRCFYILLLIASCIAFNNYGKSRPFQGNTNADWLTVNTGMGDDGTRRIRVRTLEMGVGMLGMRGMQEIRVGMRGMGVGMRGIRVRMREIRVGMREMGVGMLGVRVRMRGTRVGMPGIRMGMGGIRVEMRGIGVGMRGIEWNRNRKKNGKKVSKTQSSKLVPRVSS